MKKKLLFAFILSLMIFSSLASSVFAANTIIKTSPSTGLYTVGTAFPVSIHIDGQGDIFNAAQATVAVSSNLLVKDITLGDCNFSFVTTPTTTNPSFTGVILGGSSKSCTVYTMTVLPLSIGTGAVSFSKAEVKSYPQAQETLLAAQNSQYTINQTSQGTTSITVAPALQIAQSGTQADAYTIVLNTTTPDHKPLGGVTVILDPANPTKATGTITTPRAQSQISVTKPNGSVQFTNVPSGVHTAVVMDQKRQLAQTILNVNGANHTMVLGMTVAKPVANTTLLFSPFLILGLVLIILFALFLIWWFVFRPKKTTGQITRELV